MKSLERYVIYSLDSGFLAQMVVASDKTDCPYFTTDRNQAKKYKSSKAAFYMSLRVKNSTVIDLLEIKAVDPS